MSLVDLESFVLSLARVSGEAILPFFRSSLGVENKGLKSAFDPVTEADRAGEAAIRHMIKRAFPDHGIIGEEYGSENPDAEYVWVLDPIDGTRAFICGLPVWGTLIALTRKGVPVFGAMNQPFTRETFWGDGGRAQSRIGDKARALRTRPCGALSRATLMTTSPGLFKGEDAARYGALEAAALTARYGADCYAYCMLAAGHVDLVAEAGLQPYDILALIPIIEGAGGVVTSWDGGPAHAGGRVLAAGDRLVHAEALKILNG